VIIVKIGGSLYASPHLKEWCDQLARIHQQTLVIVPGGGPFADQVRAANKQWNLSDAVAHDMAVMAMQQYGCLLANLNGSLKVANSFKDIQDTGSTIWLPYSDVISECDYPKNWQTTSDSLALWLACKLSANHLCLVKSCEVDDSLIQQLADSEQVDGYFSTAARKFLGQTHFYHASQSTKFLNDVNNGKFN
tara:strand:+ start:497 stop:1072 length:576 start_codon:yes stop_codon:yes gene_type:complete